jgi:hypothetical protein
MSAALLVGGTARTLAGFCCTHAGKVLGHNTLRTSYPNAQLGRWSI